jgi:hypothetical protein
LVAASVALGRHQYQLETQEVRAAVQWATVVAVAAEQAVGALMPVLLQTVLELNRI